MRKAEIDTSALLDAAYASTIEPARYDDFMAILQDHLESAYDPGSTANANGELARTIDEVERHFERAVTILEHLGRRHKAHGSPEALVNAHPGAALILDFRGKVMAANRQAADHFALRIGENLDLLNLEASGVTRLKHALATMRYAAEGHLLAVSRMASANDGSSCVVVLNRVATGEGEMPLAMLSVADISWSRSIADILREAFDLTPTECEIAQGVVGGMSVEQLAEARGRSELTVKTQIKTVLRKTEARSQAELVRIVAALIQMAPPSQPSSASVYLSAKSHTRLVRAAGRQLDVFSFGPSDGRPVLFIHGMLEGLGAVRMLGSRLQRHNIRLICPSRPHFGGSDPDGGAADSPDRFADDLQAVMAHFGIEKCPVLGHMAGSVCAFAAAARLGPRITHIMTVAGGIPITSPDQMNELPARQRIVGFTAKHAPRLFPLVMRSAVALLDSGGHKPFIDALYRHAPHDHDVALRPDVAHLLEEGYKFTVAQGYQAFANDAHHVIGDWSSRVSATSQPILIVHGQHDPVMKIEHVRKFASGLGDRARLVEHAEAGQLIFYKAPEFILDSVAEFLGAKES